MTQTQNVKNDMLLKLHSDVTFVFVTRSQQKEKKKVREK